MHSCTKPITVLFCRGFFFSICVRCCSATAVVGVDFFLSRRFQLFFVVWCVLVGTLLPCIARSHRTLLLACCFFSWIYCNCDSFMFATNCACYPKWILGGVCVCVCNFDWKSPPATQHTVTTPAYTSWTISQDRTRAPQTMTTTTRKL